MALFRVCDDFSMSCPVDDPGQSRTAAMNDIYNRFFGFIGNILTGHPSGIRERLSFVRVMVVLSLLMALGSALTPAMWDTTQRSLNFSYSLSAIWTMIVVFT